MRSPLSHRPTFPAFNKCTPLRKSCCDVRAWHVHTVGMDPTLIARLERLRPAIKREWAALLRNEPTLSPLGRPDTLAYLMDETLNQLAKGARTHSLRTWLRRSPALFASLQRGCRCGLNPLLNYYSTGELALRASLHGRFPPQVCEGLLTIFHLKAQQELETLCTVCVAHGGSGCRNAKETTAA